MPKKKTKLPTHPTIYTWLAERGHKIRWSTDPGKNPHLNEDSHKPGARTIFTFAFNNHNDTFVSCHSPDNHTNKRIRYRGDAIRWVAYMDEE
jgi:hypothetical protein